MYRYCSLGLMFKIHMFSRLFCLFVVVVVFVGFFFLHRYWSAQSSKCYVGKRCRTKIIVIISSSWGFASPDNSRAECT